MFETSQHSNIHFTRVAARGEVDKLRMERAKYIECVTGTGEHHERHLLNYSKTNVIITTCGMTAKSHNVKGTVELVIPCESFDVVFQDEKQNENGENLMLTPCLLKPSSLAVPFDDKSQTPPHQPRVSRPSQSRQGILKPVQTHELRDLHMSITTSPYRPLMPKNVPIEKWLERLFDLLKERQHYVDDQSLPNVSAYESDEQDVLLVTSRHLDGLLNQAEATCMKQCSLPGASVSIL